MIAVPLMLCWVGGAVLVFLDGRRRFVSAVALGLLAASAAVTFVLLLRALDGNPESTVTGGWAAGVGIRLSADALGSVFALTAQLVLLAALAHEAGEGIRSRFFPALMLFLATGMTGLFLTGDLFDFYVFFEVSMAASLVLASYGQAAQQIRATLVFAIANLLGSAAFLISIASLYRLTGTLDMILIAERLREVQPAAVLLSATLLLVALSLKLGLFPFHYWLPILYRHTEASVTAALAGAVANIGSYGLLRFGGGMLLPELRFAAPALVALGGASVLYGSLVAVGRASERQVLAYSSISQAGYITLAVAVGGPLGFAAATIYSVLNSLNKTLLFLATGVRGPLVGFAFAVGAFSVAGVPPAAGFLGKTAVFRSTVAGDDTVSVVLIFAGSLLSILYMFRVYQRRFWYGEVGPYRTAQGDEQQEELPESSRLSQRLLVAALAVLVIVVGLWPNPLLVAGDEAAAALTAQSTTVRGAMLPPGNLRWRGGVTAVATDHWSPPVLTEDEAGAPAAPGAEAGG